MQNKLKIAALIIIALVILGITYLWWSLRPINSRGTVNLSQDQQNSQIAKAVGKTEVGSYSKYLNQIRYPGVSNYDLVRKRGVDSGDERDINFSITDSFDKIVTYYQNKLSSQPSIKANTTNAFGDTVEPYHTADFDLNPPHNSVQLNLTENKKTNSVDAWFRDIL